MPFFDLPMEELQTYSPPVHEPADFDVFWQRTLDEARAYPLNAVFTPAATYLKTVDVYDVSFAGFGGHPIKGWYLVPRHVEGPLNAVVQYIGYNGGRAFPHDWLLWSAVGCAHFIMDTRGQGSGWLPGDTPDPYTGTNPHYPGFLTQGVLDKQHYYYRRVFTDAARAIEAVRTRPEVNASRVAVLGGSQGGGIAIAAAALVPDVAACLPDVPFLCHYRRAAGLNDQFGYGEINRYLSTHRDRVEAVFNTLDYFDGVNFAPRIRAHCLFSVGLMDDICPPSTVYAAYNRVRAPKAISVYTYNKHEGGATFQAKEAQTFLAQLWGWQ
jgi:cephalosporin-C deacetylase